MASENSTNYLRSCVVCVFVHLFACLYRPLKWVNVFRSLRFLATHRIVLLFFLFAALFNVITPQAANAFAFAFFVCLRFFGIGDFVLCIEFTYVYVKSQWAASKSNGTSSRHTININIVSPACMKSDDYCCKQLIYIWNGIQDDWTEFKWLVSVLFRYVIWLYAPYTLNDYDWLKTMVSVYWQYSHSHISQI